MAEEKKSLMKRFLEAGIPPAQMFHHASDLYVYVNKTTLEIVNDWCRENGYDRGWSCPVFKSNIDGALMFDCAFAYEPDLCALGE